MTSIGTCRLCLAPDAELQDSHIFSKWVYRYVVANTPPRTNPMWVTHGKATTSSKQFRAHLLCKACEKLIGRTETYVANHIAHPTRGKPFYDHLIEVGSATSLPYRLMGLGQLDGGELVRFGVSILWRWHVDCQDSHHYLGSTYGEQFRRYLAKETEFPANACVILGAVEDAPGVRSEFHQVVTTPVSGRSANCRSHRFIVCGMDYFFIVGQRIPTDFREYCLVRGPHKRVLVMPTSHQLEFMAPLIETVPKNGGSRRKRGHVG
jgi:hypothetical protein